MKRPKQLILDLAHRPAYGAEDFFLSKNNELAVRLIDGWPNWAQYGQILIGPQASGKTHLVNVWRLRSRAQVIKAQDLDEHGLLELSYERPICVEDIDRGQVSNEALFHLLNKVNEHAGHVLLSSRIGVADLPVPLKDLHSRLLALPSVSIDAPDDQLLKAVMVKQFSDRQIEIEPDIIEYLFKRIERSMGAVTRVVDELDKGSLGTGRAITKPLAREILLNRPAD